MLRVIGFTGSRADYYLQRCLFKYFHEDPTTEFMLIVTGSILEEANRQTLDDIESDDFTVLCTISLASFGIDTNHNQMVSYLIRELDPILSSGNFDLALVYADRYESFAFAVACFHRDIIIVHLEAGDITEGGTYDDSIRHSITKISHLQLTSTMQGLEVVRRLGEETWRNTCVGLLSYDSLSPIPYQEAVSVAESLGLSLLKPIVLATFHPIPMDPVLTESESEEFFRGLIRASEISDLNVIVTSPNRDSASQVILKHINTFMPRILGGTYIDSLGGKRYQSIMSLASRHVVIVAGNSSSVVKEAPFYCAHGLNVGRRQKGREMASSQINVPANRDLICQELLVLCQGRAEKSFNPYFTDMPAATAYEFVTHVLRTHNKAEILLKGFQHSRSHHLI